MYNSGDAAEQVVRISLEGTEVALKLTGSAAKNIAAMLYAVWKNRDKKRSRHRSPHFPKSLPHCGRRWFYGTALPSVPA